MTDSSPEPTTPAANDAVQDVPGTLRTDRAAELDLDVVERDLAAVETALQRLSDGTYWTDEVTGSPIPVELLDADPLVRRA